MAAAHRSNEVELLTKASNYYRAANLTKTCLGASEASNLKDRYIVGKELGLGQFGVIRECSDKFTGEVLACKSIARSRLSTAEDVQGVKLEIEIMTRLSGHPNVVDLKEVYEEEEYVHLVMELCSGGELFDQLEKYGRFSEVEARPLFRQLMQVVLYCHENGVVHRDLKPENILLASKTSLSPIKLADFGLATYIKPGQNLYGTVGSPFYIAPDVLAGGYNQSADVWSAGVILYILLSGIPPFWGKTKSQIFDAVRAADLRFPSNQWDCISTSANSLIRGMLCKDPHRRLTAQEVLDHSWMRDQGPNSHALNLWQSGSKEIDNGKPSALCISRDHDISFGRGSHIACEAQSPTFTCPSSLASLIVEQSLPFASGGFSFCSCGSSDALKFCSPIPSMPSFAFLCPISTSEQLRNIFESPSGATSVDAIGQELSFTKGEAKWMGPTDDHRILGIHNKRNRTIGAGEREQLDFVTAESVIRWSSCTLIPTDFRSSLVC
ncbi:hypothetical protein MLD38_025653 [Melastoma candidum]|uniref:Uncharacterized protein n=1 Tax=Melastoma candidum TaxID=119954 RepID=A0ACB9NWH1_9MYRT|nr:hypothetical protein MLD38_025653 [Melastoma candidum]